MRASTHIQSLLHCYMASWDPICLFLQFAATALAMTDNNDAIITTISKESRSDIQLIGFLSWY
jgi:hypothetical protein